MATNEDLNNTNDVLSTGTPQDAQPTETGSQGTDFQSTASPERVTTDTPVAVETTGQPITGGTPATEPTSMAPYVYGGVFLVFVILVSALLIRMKDTPSSSSPSLRKSETDIPKKSTSTVTAVKKSTTTKKTATKKVTPKKVTKKRPAASRKKRR